MRMINADDVPGAAFKLTFCPQHIERIHFITVPCALGIEVFALPKGVDASSVARHNTDHQTTALVRVRRFGVVVNFSQNVVWNFQHMVSDVNLLGSDNLSTT